MKRSILWDIGIGANVRLLWSGGDWCVVIVMVIVVVIVVVIGAKERQEIASSHGVPFNLPADDQVFQWIISIGGFRWKLASSDDTDSSKSCWVPAWAKKGLSVTSVQCACCKTAGATPTFHSDVKAHKKLFTQTLELTKKFHSGFGIHYKFVVPWNPFFLRMASHLG